MLLTGQAQNLQSQSRNSILVKITNLLPEQKKQIYIRRWGRHQQENKTSDPLENETNFDVKPLSAVLDYKSFSTVANVAKAKLKQQVKLQGRFTFQGINETLIAKEKTLQTQEAYPEV